MACRQPTERHGGNAGIDEEVTAMVSSGSASLDAWLGRAEELLYEQRVQSLSLSPTRTWNDAKRESIITWGLLSRAVSSANPLRMVFGDMPIAPLTVCTPPQP